MLDLTGYIHRAELQDIMTRWLLGRFEPADCPRLKDIVNFNGYLVTRYLNEACLRLFSWLAVDGVSRVPVQQKGDLKDFIVKNPPYGSRRIDEMLSHYARYPQDYYRRAPFIGVLYYSGTLDAPRYLGHSRIKRARRLSEKGARRIVDFIFAHIKNQADILAEERAARLGISKPQLITDPQTQLEEFVHAERRVLKSIRLGTLPQAPGATTILPINDVAGVKVILENDRTHLLGEFIAANRDLAIVETEEHSGAYNATNLIVEITLDKEQLALPPPPEVKEVLFGRGVEAQGIDERYHEFVYGGEDTARFEVIVSNYGDLLESELGRCMHEDRILAQRSIQDYRSSLAFNVRYLIEYLFLFTMSPARSVSEIPFVLWEHNMPDTFDEAVKRLWHQSYLPAI